jgi:hypothetical protein
LLWVGIDPIRARDTGGRHVKKLLVCLTAIVAVAHPAPPTHAQALQAAPAATKAETKDVNLRAYVELLRSDVRSQKVAIITELMEFTEAEDQAFWPIYREYDLDLSKLNDERVTLIQEYADHFPKVTDAIADTLATKALDLEARRHTLKSKYYERLKSALSAKTAARFLQVENQLLMIIDLQIASSLPIVR